MASIPENHIDTETPSFSETDALNSFQASSYEVKDQENSGVQVEQANLGAYPHSIADRADHDHLNSDEGKLFLGGLSWDTTEEKLKEHFSKFGQIYDVVVMREPMTNRSRGFGFIHFLSAAIANQALMEEHIIDGKTVDAKKAVPKGTHTERVEKTTKIFVGGISSMVTEEELLNCFSKFGTVLSASLMMDKETGKPRGFGFVNFEDPAAVMAVMAAGPIVLGDKAVDVKVAQPRSRSNQMGRGGHSHFRHGPITMLRTVEILAMVLQLSNLDLIVHTMAVQDMVWSLHPAQMAMVPPAMGMVLTTIHAVRLLPPNLRVVTVVTPARANAPPITVTMPLQLPLLHMIPMLVLTSSNLILHKPPTLVMLTLMLRLPLKVMVLLHAPVIQADHSLAKALDIILTLVELRHKFRFLPRQPYLKWALCAF
ncbi:hypothetical protein L0F63_002904 [Massospora cicadina]|nr:hypothetical protein L0F63_002904 [Massospora cicadina]